MDAWGLSPEQQELTERCLDVTARGGKRRAGDRLLSRIVRRRNWAIHRHVHLVAAFEDALAAGDVRSVLSVGCGSGFTEMFLAASNPSVRFTLTDVELPRLARLRLAVIARGLRNVELAPLDLLEEPDRRRFDFVSAIEVLEHIGPDDVAVRHLHAYTGRFLYVLVPYCSTEELGDERRGRRAWERHQHHRLGYSHESFAPVVGEDHARILRNCYFAPEALELRRHLDELDDRELVDERSALVAEAVKDVRDELVAGGTDQAEGIEALVERLG